MNNTVKTALLLGTMSALLMFIGEALGGAGGLVIGFLFAVATNFASYWFSDKIVLRMYNAQEVGPEHRLYRHRRSPGAARRPAAAALLRDSRSRRRTRSRPAAIRSTRRWRRPKAFCGC